MDETIHDRIGLLVDEFGDKKNTVFAALIGTNEANIRGYRTGVMPKIDFLEKVARNLEINLDWLITGRGDMKRNDSQTTKTEDFKACDSLADYDKLNKEEGLYRVYKEKDEENKILLKKIWSLEQELKNLKREKTQVQKQPAGDASTECPSNSRKKPVPYANVHSKK